MRHFTGLIYHFIIYNQMLQFLESLNININNILGGIWQQGTG